MIEQEFDNIKKTKRNKHITECSVKRRTTGCGICGSENIVMQGVKHCENCGIEEEILTDNTSIFNSDISDKLCDCVEIVEYGKGKKRRTCKYNYIKTISVGKCLDCGAVRSSYCCNCGKKFKRCWKSTKGDLFCTSCGYRKTIKGVVYAF